MTGFGPRSIRTSLVLLVVFSVLPALGIILHMGLLMREQAIETIRRDALFSAAEYAEIQERITAEVRQITALLAQTPEVRAMDEEACAALFASVLKNNPVYTNIILVNAAGDAVTAGQPYPKLNLADRKYVRDALAVRGFAVGEYVLSRGGSGSVLPFAQAVLDERGAPVGVISLGISLQRYAQLFDLAALPQGSILGVLDHQGTRLLYHPPNEATNPVGKALQSSAWKAIASEAPAGIYLNTGQDGVERYYAFKQLRLQPGDKPYLYMVVGIPVQETHRALNAVMARSTALLAAAMLLALGVAWLFGNLTIVKGLKRLLQATSMVGRGDFSVRTGLDATQGELGRLGQAFDEMAAALEQDVARRKADEEGLKLAAKVFECTIEGIAVTDPQGTIQRVNPGFTAITGYEPQEVIGKNPRILKSERHGPEFYQDMWRSLLAEGHWSGEIWNRRKNGEAYPEWLDISSIKDENDAVTHYISVFHDITELKQQQKTIEYLANHDPLTGLPNRMLFEDRLDMALAVAQRRGARLALFFMDLDSFKNINDSLGHDVGDLLLQEAAGRLARAVRDMDTVYRQGGDEFIAILPDVKGPEDAMQVARRILEALGKPYRLHGYEIVSSASIGVSMYPDDGLTAQDLLKKADLAMYRAKKDGGNTVRFFTSGMDVLARRRLILETDLRAALDRNELELHYQPVVDMATGMITGAEALLRWRRGDEMIPPAECIPVAEETGLILHIGAWALATACQQVRNWRTAGLPEIGMAVNISGRQFSQRNFEEMVQGVLGVYALPAALLHLELTESALITNLAASAERLQRLRALGVKVMLDDFGTGYSSLAYLKRLPVDGLKIDRSFVREIPHDTDSLGIAAAIMAMSRVLGLDVVAEGVETREQLDYLASQGCTRMQGYFAAKPVTAKEFENLLAAGRPLFSPAPTP